MMSLFACVMFCLITGVFGSLTGCEPEVQDKCQSNLDCNDGEACVKSDKGNECKAKGGLGADCGTGTPGCLSKDTDGKVLLCDTTDNKCKNRCETNLDCDRGFTCDTNSGICVKEGGSDGGPADDPPTETSGQSLGQDCGGGLTCASGLECVVLGQQTDGKCWKSCSADSDCKDSRICAGGYCVPQGDVCQGTPGGTLTRPCYAGLECLFESAGEGKCYRTCTADGDCPTGLKCVEKGNKKYCLQGGSVAGPGQECGDVNGEQVGCQSGYQCVPERLNATKKICTKECKSDAECTWPRFCEQICTLGTVGTAQKGEVCEAKAGVADDKRCDGGLDCLTLQQGGGLCYRSCKDGRAAPCPNGTTCTTVGTEKYCLQSCTKKEDCSAPTATCGGLQNVQGQFCLHGGN
jgi:hypothetical protein